ncbi:MAG: FAD-dependent oxidoreductase, partial [Burkholderiales bacterium PBB5]
LADARAIMALAQPGARVLQMGAGFIGCIIMEALALRGVQLSVVEMGDRMVPRMMGPTAGGMIKAWCQAKGVAVYTGARVEAIERPGSAAPAGAEPMTVRLSTGQHLQTNVPGIYAAGDCAEAFDKVSGTTIVSAIQPNAAEQARVAALNMVGQPVTLKGVTQINVLDTLGLISASFGKWDGVDGGQHVELTDAAAGKHLSLQFQGDRMVGCNAIGFTEHVGVMRGLVEGQVKLGPWKDRLMADPTQLMAAYLATAQAQSQPAHAKA